MNIERFTEGDFDVEVLPRGSTFIVLAPGLARGLGHRDAGNMLAGVPEDEKGYWLVSTPGGDQRITYVTEAGFYRVVGQRQAARIKNPRIRDQVNRFQRWVFHEVLPCIRTAGHYVPPVPGNFPEPHTLTLETAAAHLRQRYGLPVHDAMDLADRLKDAGILKLTGTPSKGYRDLFWPVGRRFEIHAHALPVLAGRVTRELYRLAEAQAGVQTALELDAIERATLARGTH